MGIGGKLLYFNDLDSTNAYLATRINAGNYEDGLMVRTDFQSKGRGYGKNHWESNRGENLLFSFVIRPDFLPPEQQFDISRIVCLSLLKYLESYAEGFKIKWPNDILFNQSKIAGILIEHQISGNSLANSIIGIGINLNQTQFSPEAGRPCSLKNICGRQFNPADELNLLINYLNQNYQFLKEGNRDAIHRNYLQYLYRYRIWSKFEWDNTEYTGRISGVNEYGQLELELPQGEILSFGFKEIIFR